VFAFGIGSSVNHFLLDQMAREGRGEVDYVGLEDDGSAAARRFQERVRTPLLTDLRLEWSGVSTSEIYPARLPDLFSAKPLIVSGRYDSPGRGTLRLRGKQAGRDFVREVPVVLPADQPAHPVLATLWARRKVDALMAQNWADMQSGNPGPEIREAITKLGVNFGLMTQFTSFVAVEEPIRTEGGRPMRVDVPVEMPAGVSYEGIYGNERREFARQMSAPLSGSLGAVNLARGSSPIAAPPPPPRATDEIDRRAKLGSAGARDAEAQNGGFVADNRKIDPALLASVSGVASTNLPRTIQVKIWLSDTTPEGLAKLKEAGFIAQSGVVGGFITGECDAARLSDLAKLSVVRYISKP
jgi:Ca-activated chloride channel family protein